MDEHYFSADPSVPFKREPGARCEVWGHELDAGQRVGGLRRRVGSTSAPRSCSARPSLRAPGRILDLGCGYGVIGLADRRRRAGARWSPASTSTSGRCCWRTRTPRRSGSPTGSGRSPDAVAADATYDEIWSNPPIRIGKAALHELLLTWLPRLAPDGRAVMVVGKNLGADSLQRWLGDQGYPTERLASAKGFRVLETRREA